MATDLPSLPDQMTCLGWAYRLLEDAEAGIENLNMAPGEATAMATIAQGWIMLARELRNA